LRLSNRISLWLSGALRRRRQTPRSAAREPQTHVVILDGTMSSLEDGSETNAGRAYKLLCEAAPDVSLYYEAGVQWRGLRSAPDVMMGRGITLLWRWSESTHAFHNHALGRSVRHGFHALARDETRAAYVPVLWDCPEDWQGRVEQVWFPGTHGDVGGQLGGFEAARPLANIPLVWMLERVESCGLDLPQGWRSRFEMDPLAPSVSTWRGFGKLFWLRGPRTIACSVCERLHHTVHTRQGRILPPVRIGRLARVAARMRRVFEDRRSA